MDRAVAVIDRDGEVVLYDIFIDKIWHGSRRTPQQVREYHGNLGRTVDIAWDQPDHQGDLLT